MAVFVDDFRIPQKLAGGSGGWFTALVPAVGGTFSITRGQGYLTPVHLGFQKSHNFSAVGTHVITAGGVGAVIRLGVFQLDPDTLTVTQLLQDAGTVSATTTGFKTIAISLTTINVQWIAVAQQAEGTASVPLVRAVSTNSNFFTPLFGHKPGDPTAFANKSFVMADITTVSDGAFDTVLTNFQPFFGSANGGPLAAIRENR